jgi:hypothetical protein
VTVTLAGSDPAVATVLGSVTVPEGATTATFPVTTDTVASSGTTITASLGEVTKTASLTTLPLGVVALTASTEAVTGGSGANVQVVLNGPAPDGGLVVTLASDETWATVPASVTVPAGATVARFPVTTLPVPGDRSAVLTATTGELQEELQLTVKPPVLASLSLSAASVKGGETVTGTLTLNGPAPANGVSVGLASNKTSVATLAASLLIPSGERRATFTITTSTVTAATVVRITATRGDATPTAMVTITP